jgi:hypothetical protein
MDIEITPVGTVQEVPDVRVTLVAASAGLTGNTASASMTIMAAAKILDKTEEKDFDIMFPHLEK